MIKDVWIGRQAIYSPKLEVTGYELLYRSGRANRADFDLPDAATAQVLLSSLAESGLEQLVGKRRAFINMTRALLLGPLSYALPAQQVVLEVLEDTEPDEELCRALGRLRARGFDIALDDYLPGDPREVLLEFASVVKFDCRGADLGDIERERARLARPSLAMLAEKVETRQEFERCVDAGFDLFQGYFLQRPESIHRRMLSPSRMRVMRIVSKLYDPKIELAELSVAIQQDVALSYHLLRHVNSALFSLASHLRSVHEAVVFLGRRNVQNLCTLFLIAGMDDQPTALVHSSMLRGRMCELLAAAAKESEIGGHFTVGMFSLLDAILEQPMAELMQHLPLAPEIQAALLRGEGRMGEILGCVVSYERCEFQGLACTGLEDAEIRAAYLEAVRWADALITDLSGSQAS